MWRDEGSKIAGGCGAKRVSKSTCFKKTFVEIVLLKKSTRLWRRQARFEVKRLKKHPNAGSLLEGMLRGHGADFLRGVAFWSIRSSVFRFAEMILRDRCSTSCDLAPLFRSWRNAVDRWDGIAKRLDTKPSALH